MRNNYKKRRLKWLADLAQARRKECENKTFKLVGIVNPIGIYPDFVFPVFICEQDGKKYLQEGDDNTLNSFFETEPYRDLKNIIFLENINMNDFTPSVYTIHSRPLFAFQIAENDYFIGYADDMKIFFEKFSTEDKILRKSIEDFMRSINI